MCGISGIIDKHSKIIDEDEIRQMNDLISHRGPDDEGYFWGDHFALGHRRLSIIDLSSDAHQPMSYNDKYVIVYNGEVYNYLEIKEELMNLGYLFHTKSDTEVILAAYDQWGFDCLKKFNGMWAFAIFDKEKNIIFCSRDRFGVKPFYYTEVNGKFIFGSEIKQLLAFLPARYVNKNILMDYIVLGYEDHSNETFFENIFKLGQSHNLIYNLTTHQYNIQRYYEIRLNESLNRADEVSAVNAYRNKLTDGIKLRLRSDVKVGTCLSGGLDSSSVASIASRLYESDDKFLAIHAKSSELKSDESAFAIAVSSYSHLDLNIIEPTKNDFFRNIENVITAQEEPFGSPSIFLQYFVMRKARELNCKVLLDGQGGDETLLGYERFYPAFLKGQRLLAKIKVLLSARRNSKLSISDLIKYYVYFTNVRIRFFRLKTRNSFIKKKYFDLVSKSLLTFHSRSYLDILTMQINELFCTPLPSLLRYADKNSMRHSIEGRLPFLDYQTLETALSINNQYKIKNGWTKYILRKSVEKDKILPDSIIWRKNKLGFDAPEKTWMDSLNGHLTETIHHSKILSEVSDNSRININNLDNRQKWKLFNIAKWEKIYNVSIR
ncbi:MAG: asparagine synthase (glutamine-hydrolyzing) [Deltaproteobacteria bacterium HGW-Deltaproteobacteria-1]|jgi:asparagine synthase (glutamine-hydrolysing)|nr:MAG: asparagine synthase (glutamine-hydrolyzing) [Deltaproteobacteria bacterium HGW-Deltaproteobacteria-1]